MKRRFSSLVVLLAAAGFTPDLVVHHDSLVNPEATMAECLSCHDGSKATNVTLSPEMSQIFDKHLTGGRYPPKGGRAAYASVEALAAKGLKLDDGRITCYTCHDLRSSEEDHLRRPGTELCKTCHHRH